MTYGEGEGIIRSLRTEGGFWIPNSVIDRDFDYIKARGLATYCLLARAVTKYQYPGIVDLACKLRVTERKATDVVNRLESCGLLNEYDMKAIFGIL